MKITTTLTLAISILCSLVTADRLFAAVNEDGTSNDRYRLEIILFQMLENNAVGRLSETLNQYTGFSAKSKTTADHSLTKESEPLTQSAIMANAWKRLLGSREFLPLLVDQWQEQRAGTVSRAVPGGVKGTATRIHGEVTIFPPSVNPERSIGYSTVNPTVYQLDGLATFTQGRFLHVALNFEFRQLLVKAETADNTESPNIYMVFSLEKSRQLRPQRLEFFDNEKFGALIYLEEVEQAEETLPEDIPDAES